MFASAGEKQRRVSSHSDDLRKIALHNSYLQRRMAQLSHTKDSANQPDISRSSATVRPLRPVIDDRSIARSPSATSMAYTYVLALRSLGRRTTTSLDFPLHHPRNPSQDRQHLSSPTRRNNPHPNGLVYQSSYNRHNKAFEIWLPNKRLIQSRLPKMMHHLKKVNFLCEHTNTTSSGAKE